MIDWNWNWYRQERSRDGQRGNACTWQRFSGRDKFEHLLLHLSLSLSLSYTFATLLPRAAIANWQLWQLWGATRIN